VGAALFPVFGIYGNGRYRLQPIYVDDLAAAVLDRISSKADETVDAIGPETFHYRDMVEMIAREIRSQALIVPMPPMLAYQSVRVLGWLMGDVITTPDEVKGLMQGRLCVESPPLGHTKLSDWVREFQARLGRRYTSEMRRRLDRVSGYRSKLTDAVAKASADLPDHARARWHEVLGRHRSSQWRQCSTGGPASLSDS
jgi:NADH dehydrogenase